MANATFGLRIPGHGAAEIFIDFTEERKNLEANPTCSIHQSRTASRHICENEVSPLGKSCPGNPHQRSPNTPKFEDRSQEETEWQERCAREAAWRLAEKYPEAEGENKSTFFSPTKDRCLLAPSKTLTGGKRLCRRLRGVDAHDKQKGFEFHRIENRKDFEKSYDGHNSQWTSADE